MRAKRVYDAFIWNDLPNMLVYVKKKKSCKQVLPLYVDIRGMLFRRNPEETQPAAVFLLTPTSKAIPSEP